MLVGFYAVSATIMQLTYIYYRAYLLPTKTDPSITIL